MGEAGFKPNPALWGGGGGGGGEILGYFREKHNVESAYLQV